MPGLGRRLPAQRSDARLDEERNRQGVLAEYDF